MTHFNSLLIRCDAGLRYGLGHLSRCLTLSQVFDFSSVTFVVKTDARDMVEQFLLSSGVVSLEKQVFFLPTDASQQDDLSLLETHLNCPDRLLFLDHYEVNDAYQHFLQSLDIQWLQFDSHAKINVYADWVLHGSAAATKEIYQPLVRNENTQLLVGADYAVIKPEVRELRQGAKLRNKLQQLLICFGGGNDFGATEKVLTLLDADLLKHIRLKVSVKGDVAYLDDIKRVAKKIAHFEIISHDRLAKEMAVSDLAIVAPGMISYEAACLGLPMFLVTTADNQQINARGWVENGCAKYLGSSLTLDKQTLLSELSLLLSCEKSLSILSKNCFDCIDGQGVYRVKNSILGDV